MEGSWLFHVLFASFYVAPVFRKPHYSYSLPYVTLLKPSPDSVACSECFKVHITAFTSQGL